MIKAVVFDVDNTLVDFMKFKRASVDAAVDAMIDAGLDLTPDQARKRIFEIYDTRGIEFQLVFDEFLKDILGYVDYRILSSGIVAYRRAREGILVTYPHTRMALLRLARMGLKLGVVSDAPRLQAWMRLASLGMVDHFDVVVTFDDTGRRKPAPEPFRKALELLAAKPGEAVMVGDWAERDIVGAKEIGMHTAFARYGDEFGTVNSGADIELTDILQLIPFIERVNAGGRAAEKPRRGAGDDGGLRPRH
ncbi:MAG TPA: HAD family hydrolase [candidate division WOR-3 bacterium]|uniref:HAD family hydrolase n=1 Tax=candidate division WOR-3 bacterium TaxID=2052148 RepID=A0A7V0T6W2_UNCW3|nr:HAD family hydrolase [candidate division WOR-3 bacterium]